MAEVLRRGVVSGVGAASHGTGRPALIDRSWVDVDIAADFGVTVRQVEVLAGYAAGLSREEIARALVLSEDTVRVHIRRAHRRLEVATTAAAVARLYDLGILLPRCSVKRVAA